MGRILRVFQVSSQVPACLLLSTDPRFHLWFLPAICQRHLTTEVEGSDSLRGLRFLPHKTAVLAAVEKEVLWDEKFNRGSKFVVSPSLDRIY